MEKTLITAAIIIVSVGWAALTLIGAFQKEINGEGCEYTPPGKPKTKDTK